MDIYDYLKRDHERVNQLFKQFDATKNAERKIEIITFLIQELLTHAKSEQETFYKALEPNFESHDEVLHGRKEHAEIEKQVALILESNSTDANWQKKVEKLKELVTHHVHEEENKIFSQAQKVLSEEDANILKEQMHYLKQNLLRKLEKAS